jgi:hypothetical protein
MESSSHEGCDVRVLGPLLVTFLLTAVRASAT